MTEKEGLCIIVFSGDMDKVLAALNLANGALAMGQPARLFFTFWGTAAIKQSTSFRGKHLLQSMFGAILPVGPKRLPLSQYNFGGFGAWGMRYLMRSFGMDSTDQLLHDAVDLGAEIYVCSTSMEIVGIKKEELLPLDGMKECGVATFMELANKSQTTLFV